MEFIRVEDCCEILDSQRKPVTESERVAGIYPYYGANGLQGTINQYIFDDKLVLVAEDGGHFGSNTKPIAYLVNGKCWVNNHAHVLRAKKGFLAEYICYSLMFYKVEGYINGATRQKLTQAALRKLVIPKKSVEYQKVIVDRLDLVKCIIEKKRNIINELDLLIKSRFEEVFNLAAVNNVSLSRYIKVLKSGKSLAGESHNTNKVLKTGAVSFDYFNDKEVKNLPVSYKPLESHRVNVGDVIISRMNTAELVGAAGYVWSIDNNVYLPDRLWSAILDENINPIFVWQLIIHPKTKLQIQRIATGTSGSMKNISKQKLLDIKVPWVSIIKQNELSNFVSQINKLKSDVQKSIDETQLLMDSLMQEYFG